MNYRSKEKVHADIARVLHDSIIDQKVASEIAFHMTDWKSDLERLVMIYDKNSRLTDKETSNILHQFLAHVPNHLAAAMKLIGYGPVEDIFEVGITEADE